MTKAGVHSFPKEYYETFYTDYARQNPPAKMAFYKKLVDRAAASVTRPCLLDAGCAFGTFLSTVSPDWIRLGTDLSEYAVRKAKQALPLAHFVVADACAVPFRRTFDVIVAFDILEHIQNQAAIARSIHSNLSGGGYFIFVVPVYDGPTGPFIRLLDRDTTHVHKEPRAFWLEWASTYFEVCEWQGMFRCLLPGGWYIHIPTKTLRSFTPAIAVITRKKKNSFSSNT